MPPAILGAAIVGGAGLAGAAISGSAAKSAAQTQADAETQAANVQKSMYDETAARLTPFTQVGQNAETRLEAMAPFNFAPTQANLEQTPGYQFNLSQGLKATQNGYAAQGLGTSGAALKGGAAYATGLADSTYQNQFANALDTYKTNLSTQQNLASLGENAAANTGNFATTTAANIGQTAVGAANATAAGTVGAANATTGGINSLANAYLYGTNQFNQNAGASIYSLPQTGDAALAGLF